jgi:hypothetical protein
MRRTSPLSVGPIALDGRAAGACVELTNEKSGARTEQVCDDGATAVAIVADISESPADGVDGSWVMHLVLCDA